MKIIATCCVVALPMLLFGGLVFLLLDGRIGVATMVACAFAIGAITVTATVFHREFFGAGEAEQQR